MLVTIIKEVKAVRGKEEYFTEKMIGWLSILGLVSCAELDAWPSDITNMGRLFQTAEEHPEQVKLNYYGRVPRWIEGSFYRNGPGRRFCLSLLFMIF